MISSTGALKEYFDKSRTFDCDCYVADFTEQTNNRRGVEISSIPFEDIDYFHLKKKHQNQSTPYLAINLEEYPAFVKGKENCECVFVSTSQKAKPWSLFLETKYCHAPENIEEYQSKTILQMDATLKNLEENGLMNGEDFNIYFAYSVPTQSESEPFYPFSFKMDFILELQAKGIKFYGYNTVLIATPQYLQIPYKQV